LRRFLADPAMKERLEKAGVQPVSATPAEFDAFIRSESERWAAVLRDSGGIKVD